MVTSYGAASVVRVMAEAGPYGEPIDGGSRMRKLVHQQTGLTWTKARSWKPAGPFSTGDGKGSYSTVTA